MGARHGRRSRSAAPADRVAAAHHEQRRGPARPAPSRSRRRRSARGVGCGDGADRVDQRHARRAVAAQARARFVASPFELRLRLEAHPPGAARSPAAGCAGRSRVPKGVAAHPLAQVARPPRDAEPLLKVIEVRSSAATYGVTGSPCAGPGRPPGRAGADRPAPRDGIGRSGSGPSGTRRARGQVGAQRAAAAGSAASRRATVATARRDLRQIESERVDIDGAQLEQLLPGGRRTGPVRAAPPQLAEADDRVAPEQRPQPLAGHGTR